MRREAYAKEAWINLKQLAGTKFIFVTGGVISSVGKGILAASLGRLFKAYGLKVNILKLDPYLNPDPGTLSPYEHGEVFVTHDGFETDLDLGHYERFLEQEMSVLNSASSGKMIQNLLQSERQGFFEGHTVQLVPHLTSMIQQTILKAARGFDLILIEIGGTVGDIEAQPFLIAAQQLQQALDPRDRLHLHLTWLLQLSDGSLKTKPTQHSLKELRSTGILPEFLFCRSESMMEAKVAEKLVTSCGLKSSSIFSLPTLSSVYEVPSLLFEQGVMSHLSKALDLHLPKALPQDPWMVCVESRRAQKVLMHQQPLKIMVIAKYAQGSDPYRSIIEALESSAAAQGYSMDIAILDAVALELHEGDVWKKMEEADGILVAGGFGSRGVEGKMMAAQHARLHNIPYFGICLGMQVGLIELARNLLGQKEAHSTEFDPRTPYPIVSLIRQFTDCSGVSVERSKKSELGGTLRLGKQPVRLVEGTHLIEAHQVDLIEERHRHRYEVHERLTEPLQAMGLRIAARTLDGALVEAVEYAPHPWWVGCQYHPEFTATFQQGHPLFVAFLKAAATRERVKALAF